MITSKYKQGQCQGISQTPQRTIVKQLKEARSVQTPPAERSVPNPAKNNQILLQDFP